MRKLILVKIMFKVRGIKDSWEVKWWLIVRVIVVLMYNLYKKSGLKWLVKWVLLMLIM